MGGPRPGKAADVLIIGGGPIGLALAAELGRRGIRTVLVDSGPVPDGRPDPASAKMIMVSVRTMEFCRQLGVAHLVRDWGFPLGHGLDSVFVTSLTGHELGRVRTPTLAEETGSAASPERDRPCPQTWFDPILRDFAVTTGNAELRYATRLTSFVQDAGGVTATLRDATGTHQLRARYLVGCDGFHSTVRGLLGIEVRGERLDQSASVYVRIPKLDALHDKGEAYRYAAVGAAGVWAVLTTIDGRDLYRLQLIGDSTSGHGQQGLADAVRRVLGADTEFTIESVSTWERKMMVADRFRDGRVFLAGDAAHAHPPNGGLGMNTGIPDAWDLGWKLAAVLLGWGGPALLDSYDIERRPACHRAAAESLRNFRRLTGATPAPALLDDTAEGERARWTLGARLVAENERAWHPVGIHLGYLAFPSPVVVDDGSPVPEDDAMSYAPASRPGARAPHVWLSDGRSTLDLFGPGFTLLDFGGSGATQLEEAAHQRSVPLRVHRITDVGIGRIYERRLVLVRPDGHVAWRADAAPDNPLDLIDTARGAGLRAAARKEPA
ncbi:MAG: FAD-dependent monooxygenase [Actinobacteria bacterium]|nr:FAD-dependent monooxygenase [Actinomycetota bacterium]